jgi:formylglycine-generating enzyme required for sulfatase activity
MVVLSPQAESHTSAEAALEAPEVVRARTSALIVPISRSDLERSHSPLMSPLVWDLGHIAAQFKEWRLDHWEPLDPRKPVAHVHGYPGFVAHPYREYSEVFLGTEYKVLRGGSWATSARVATPAFRDWDLSHRRQIFAGLRLARDAC